MKKKGKFSSKEMQESNGEAGMREERTGGEEERPHCQPSDSQGEETWRKNEHTRGFAVRFSREGCKSSARKFRDFFFPDYDAMIPIARVRIVFA